MLINSLFTCCCYLQMSTNANYRKYLRLLRSWQNGFLIVRIMRQKNKNSVCVTCKLCHTPLNTARMENALFCFCGITEATVAIYNSSTILCSVCIALYTILLILLQATKQHKLHEQHSFEVMDWISPFHSTSLHICRSIDGQSRASH